MSGRRKFNDVVLTSWCPEMAYLLGQFKAGGNFSINRKSKNRPIGYFYGITINTTNLQHLIKLQILLSSNHRIEFDISNQRKHGGNARMRFIFNIKNQHLLDDLRRFGFSQAGSNAPNANAPFPENIPKELIPHYIRGYFDERATTLAKKKQLSISGRTKDFLLQLSNVISNELGLSPRTVHQKYGAGKKKAKSYFMVYSGEDQLAKIFKYLYLFVPSSLYCIEKYHKFCQTLSEEEGYTNIDVNLDVKSLYLLHEYCCEKNIDPNIFIQANLGVFLSHSRKHNLIPNDKIELIEAGKKVALTFNYGKENTDWDKVFSNLHTQSSYQ